MAGTSLVIKVMFFVSICNCMGLESDPTQHTPIENSTLVTPSITTASVANLKKTETTGESPPPSEQSSLSSASFTTVASTTSFAVNEAKLFNLAVNESGDGWFIISLALNGFNSNENYSLAIAIMPDEILNITLPLQMENANFTYNVTGNILPCTNYTISLTLSDNITHSHFTHFTGPPKQRNLRAKWLDKYSSEVSLNALNCAEDGGIAGLQVKIDNQLFNICSVLDENHRIRCNQTLLSSNNDTLDSCKNPYNVSLLYTTGSALMPKEETVTIESREPGSPTLENIKFQDNENVWVVKVKPPVDNADCVCMYCVEIFDKDNTTVATKYHNGADTNNEIWLRGEKLEYCVKYYTYLWATKEQECNSSVQGRKPHEDEIEKGHFPSFDLSVDRFSDSTCINVTWQVPVKWKQCITHFVINVMSSEGHIETKVLDGKSNGVVCNLKISAHYNVSVNAISHPGQLIIGTSNIKFIEGKVVLSDTSAYIATIVILSLIAVIISAIYFYKIRQDKMVQRRGSSLLLKLGRRYSHPIKVRDLPKTTTELLASAGRLLEMEFEDLNILSAAQKIDICRSALTSENKIKNRYTDVLPYEHSRVRLNGEPGDLDSNYINASYIMGYNGSQEYIASQGPKNNTLEDFWRMIWEQNIFIVVMVTGLVERGKIKCDQYWPDIGQAITFNDLSVNCGSENSTEVLVKRTFKVQFGDDSREVHQFCFKDWPDFGCPARPEMLIKFIEIVRLTHLSIRAENVNSPILVHCSAGVGRTGTFIVVDWLIQEASAREEIDIFSTTLQIRSNRMKMVQSEEQYGYIYKCLSHYVSTRLLSLQAALNDDTDQECLIRRNSIPLNEFGCQTNSNLRL